MPLHTVGSCDPCDQGYEPTPAPTSTLLWLARKTKKTGYIEHCQTVRLGDDGNLTWEVNGPGSAWMELHAALHRAIGIGAAAVTTWLTTRPSAR